MNFDGINIKNYTPELDDNDKDYLADMLDGLVDDLRLKDVSMDILYAATLTLYYTFIAGYAKARIEMEHKR